MTSTSERVRTRNLRRWLVCASVLCLAIPTDAAAFVPIPVGGHPGEVDAFLRVGYEGGLIEPTENKASWQNADWWLFQVGAGYTVGAVGPFQDFFFRLDQTFYAIPAETSLATDRFDPELAPPSRCLGKVLDGGDCEFHPADNGWLLTPIVGANLIHEATHSFGVFLQGTIPIGVEHGKFVLPRVDYVAGGLQTGVHLTSWFGFSNRIYVGSGDFGGDDGQNPAIAITTLFHLDSPRFADRVLKLGIALGPYFEGDLLARGDEVYDAAYTAGYDDGVRDRVQAMKFGIAIAPYVQISDHFAIDGGYVQKLFGYDAPATQFFYGGVRFAHDLDD